MSEELRKKLLPKFRETTADRIEKIQTALLDLEKGAGGPDNVQELQRELHTLKGESRIMGFIGISQVVHAAEDLLKVVLATPSAAGIDALLKTCDAIPPMVEAPADGGPEAAALVEKLVGLVTPATATAAAAAPPSAEKAPAKPPEPPEPEPEPAAKGALAEPAAKQAPAAPPVTATPAAPASAPPAPAPRP
ncbi:MAG TPA: Hpt domain-containing protein, partial [Anaeromyxobacteraceae bacterium]|nr:Hpt domain-containing protein [Anaeromyxobacteraceae bacterium]